MAYRSRKSGRNSPSVESFSLTCYVFRFLSGPLSNLQAVSKGYQSVLETLYWEGYELKNTLLNPTTNLTTLILVKPG